MANAWYSLFKQDLLNGLAGRDLGQDTVNDGPYCALVDTGVYTYSATHHFVNPSLTGRAGTDQRISAPTVANGVFDGNDLTFTAVPAGPSIEALVIYRHQAGADTTWCLVLYLDTSITGLPVTPNGGNITVTWHASGIASLSDGNAKENEVKIGTLGKAEVYEYSYRSERARHVGLIAQQVEQYAPGAVVVIDGVKHVDYVAALVAALTV